MARYDILKIPVAWLPESIKEDEWEEDGLSIWQTKDLNNEYDIYIFNPSRQMFMSDYIYEIHDSPNRLLGIKLVPKFTSKIRQSIDDSLVCLAKPSTKLYKIKVKILSGAVESIKIIGIKDYKTEL